MKKYYRARLIQKEYSCNDIWFDEFQVIHETKCFVYCIELPVYTHRGDFERLKFIDGENETDLQLAKRFNIPIKRIHKEGSRFAFENKELAFKQLKFIKGYHLKHLRYQLMTIEKFMTEAKGKSYAEYESSKQTDFLRALL